MVNKPVLVAPHWPTSAGYLSQSMGYRGHVLPSEACLATLLTALPCSSRCLDMTMEKRTRDEGEGEESQ